MANQSGVVGVLRALLTADTAQFDTSMRKSAQTTEKTADSLSKLGKETAKLTPQAERMAKAFGGERLLASANNLVAAVTKIGGASKLTEAEQRRVNSTLDAAIAKYRALGQQAPKDMIAIANATKQAGSATSILGSTFATLTASFTTAAVITGATTALTGFVRSAISGAGALVDMSAKTGLSTETLQRMAFVADQTGGSLEDFTGAAFQLGIRVAEGSKQARDAFADLSKASTALGVSFEQFQRLTPDEQFARITAALHDVQDQQERNRIGVALMGRQYATIAAAVSQNYNEMAQAAKVSTDAQIRAIDDAADAWGAFLKSTTTNVQANLGNIILFAQAVKQAISEMGVFSSTAAVVGRAQDILALGLLKTREQDIELQKTQAQAHEKTKEELEAEKKAADALAQRYATLATLSAQAFGLDKVKAAADMIDAIGGMAGVVLMDADAIKSLNALMTDAIDAARRNGKEVPLEWLRIEEATRSNVGTLQDYLKLVGELPKAMQDIPAPPELIPFKSELDQERIRKLLEQNAPGTGIFKEAGGRIGETIGTEIRSKLLNAFEDIPHFLTSSVLHSGSFINGLKALGVSMADAIVEPLLKQFAMKLAGAAVGSRLASAAGIGVGAATLAGGAAAGGTVAAEVGATAAATTAAVGGGAGGAAAAGGGFGSAIAGFATNPITLAVAAAAVGGFLLTRHFRKGARANDARDKDLAQFAGFDTAADKQDTANPPGFHGLDRLLTKHKRHDLFGPFVTARDPKAVRAAFAPIQAFMAGLGRNVKSFNMGGFVPPGVVQPAILHGGSFGEAITPLRSTPGAGALGVVPINVYLSVSAVDAPGVQRLVRSQTFGNELRNVMRLNLHGVGTTMRHITTGET